MERHITSAACSLGEAAINLSIYLSELSAIASLFHSNLLVPIFWDAPLDIGIGFACFHFVGSATVRVYTFISRAYTFGVPMMVMVVRLCSMVLF